MTEVPPSPPGTREWLDDYILRYMEAWNRADLDAIVDAYHTPCFVHKQGTMRLHLDDTEKRAYFGELLGGTLAELDAGSRWERPELRVERLGPEGALMTVRWVFRRRDGESVEDYFDSYLFGAVDGRWAFLGDTVWSTEDSSES